MKKLRIGITGGIGSGKSKFCEVAKSLGYKVLLADEISKDILANDSDVKKEIIESFGASSFIDNAPNKKFLAEQVFSNPEQLLKINSILHPPTLSRINKLMDEYLKTDNLVFVESALIYEIEIEEMFDYVVLVTATDENKIKRVSERSGLSAEEIKKRIDNQLTDDEKKGWADFTLENNGTEQDFANKCGFIINLLKSL